MKKYTVELTREQLEQLGIEVEPEFKYPLFKRRKSTGEISKFTDIAVAETVWQGGSKCVVGYKTNYKIPHTTDGWEDVAYDRKRDLWDGQPVECWDSKDTNTRTIRFYDAINKCAFYFDGERNGPDYDNYKAVPAYRYDEWELEAFKTLQK